MLTSLDEGSEEAVEGPDFWLKRFHTYQAREVQEPEKKKITNSEKGGSGMVEVGRRGEVASPPKPIVGSKRSCPKINNNSNSENGSGGIWWWVGRDGDTSPLKPMPGSERS